MSHTTMVLSDFITHYRHLSRWAFIRSLSILCITNEGRYVVKLWLFFITIIYVFNDYFFPILYFRLVRVYFKNNRMSSIALRRLAITCRPTSSTYKYQRTFTTSSPLLTETNTSSSSTTNTADEPRTVTLIPGK